MFPRHPKWLYAALLLVAVSAWADSFISDPEAEAADTQSVVESGTSGAADLGQPAAAGAGLTALQQVKLALEPDRVQWQAMQLRAKKLMLSASTDVELEFLDSGATDALLIPATRGVALTPDAPLVSLRTVTRFFGRESRLQALMAPDDAQIYQYIRDALGSHTKHRIYRYTDTGIFIRTHRPVDKAELDLPWESWTDISDGWRDIEPAAHGAVIVEPLAILYAVAAADLAPGAALEFLSMSDKKVVRVTLTALPAAPRKVDFDLVEPSGTVRCRGNAPAIQLHVDGVPIDSDGASNFEFLGLQEDINIYIEPATRLVLEVSGKAPIVGDTVIRLQQATLNRAGGCPVT